jgi:DNA (cytosine-5)-methyltransferase 1
MTAPTARPAAPPTGRPVILDAYSGAGGAAVGYHRAGFDVVGVDIVPQPRYPFAFEQGDAIEFIRRHGRDFDAIHASPVCKGFTRARHMHGGEYPNQIPATRAALRDAGRPYVIENVPEAPLLGPFVLCGTMFGLKVYRHRAFETSCFMLAPRCGGHPDRLPDNCVVGPHGFVTIAGNHGHTAYAPTAMGIDWMGQHELAQAIPPAYAHWLGVRLLRALGRAA